MKKFSVLLIAALLVTACVPALPATAAEDIGVIYEEGFESYEKDVNVNSTSMTNVFVCDYNSIGDGLISVVESSDGNLYLKSHVFTQIYTDTPITGAYEFSLDVFGAQGNIQSGVLVRAPKTEAAYYESDGYPDTSTCLSGIYINPHENKINVNVKTYNAGAESTCYIDNNMTVFRLPDGVTFPYNLKIKDDTKRISILVNDELICAVEMSEPGKTYENHQATEECFGLAVMYDKDGKEIGRYKDPLLQSKGATVGWSTRACDMEVDNVKLSAGKTYAALLAISVIPAKVTKRTLEDAQAKVKHARELYDALPDDQKALITNVNKLTDAEEIIKKLAPETTAEITTEPAADTQTETETAVVTTAADDGTGNGTTAAETAAEEETVTMTADDSLVIYILIAVMIAAVFAAAGFAVIKLRRK